MAEGVEKCVALRGWKNVNLWNHDQGLIVAYIKTDGAVYYRNYCKQPPDQGAIWEIERQIVEFPVPTQNISVFRTNDYRTGILCESSGKLYWVIAERDWAGMAYKRNNFSVPEVTSELIPINNSRYIMRQRLNNLFTRRSTADIIC